jgi:predicted small lipoprotein YifL
MKGRVLPLVLALVLALWRRSDLSGGVGLVRLRPQIMLVVAGLAVLALGGCGRNGPLELPPGPAVPAQPVSQAPLTQPDGTPIPGSQQDAAAVKNGFDQYGRPVAAQGEKKSFFLDPLLQ